MLQSRDTVTSITTMPSLSEGSKQPSQVLFEDKGVIHNGQPHMNYGLPPALYNATLARLDFYLHHLYDDEFLTGLTVLSR
jgi:hypothetical protein